MARSSNQIPQSLNDSLAEGERREGEREREEEVGVIRMNGQRKRKKEKKDGKKLFWKEREIKSGI